MVSRTKTTVLYPLTSLLILLGPESKLHMQENKWGTVGAGTVGAYSFVQCIVQLTI